MYGIIDFSKIDTEPGAVSAFAPPAGFQGGEKEYRAFMRKAWKSDPGVRQHVIAVGRMLARNQKVEFQGRFADIARRIAERSR